MKANFPGFFILFSLHLVSFNLSAQVIASDSLALVDLYDSTGGKNWVYDNNRNWKTNEPVGTWRGITVSNSRVTSISLMGSQASGKVPTSFRNLDGLLYINLIDNGFEGDLLSYVTYFKDIVDVHIGEYHLPGPFPDSFGYLTKLQSINVYGPNCDGPIPRSFGNLVNLQRIDIGSSAHSDYIPAEELSNLNLTTPFSLVLTGNRFTFKELEPLAAAFKAKNKEVALEYDYQANIPTLQLRDALAVSAGGVLAHNTYRWYAAGGTLIATIIGDSTFNPISPGSYYATISNSVATKLTLTSEPLQTTTLAFVACPQSSTISIGTNLAGGPYQWQESVDSVNFHDITKGDVFGETQNATLQMQNIPSSWYGRKYRCVTNGVSSVVYTLQFVNNWIGTEASNWENLNSWSCGKLPDANTDVYITNGSVTLNSNATVRSLHVASGAVLTVGPGHKLIVTH